MSRCAPRTPRAARCVTSTKTTIARTNRTAYNPAIKWLPSFRKFVQIICASADSVVTNMNTIGKNTNHAPFPCRRNQPCTTSSAIAPIN